MMVNPKELLGVQRDFLTKSVRILIDYIKNLNSILNGRMQFELELIKELYSEIADFKMVKKPEGKEKVKVGDTTTYTKRLEYADVYLFSLVSGDWNPLHHDAEYAAKTKFGRNVVHGMLTSSLISNALALFPGTVVLLRTAFKYLKPVYIGDTVTARAEIVEELPKGRYRVKTSCINQKGEEVVEGECIILIW